MLPKIQDAPETDGAPPSPTTASLAARPKSFC